MQTIYVIFTKAVFELLQEVRGKNEACVFARSATVGGQKFPVHWGGDCSATYESMAESLRGGLSLSLSGFAFWSHDISGFEKTATPDLFKRWAAFGLLSTHSRLHGNESYRVPWNFDEEASGVVRFFAKLKCALMPYLYRKRAARRRRLPSCVRWSRSFRDDRRARSWTAISPGSSPCAPIFGDDGAASYYLPAGVGELLTANDRRGLAKRNVRLPQLRSL
jgi:alpha-D-xyloside xylohydrolase